MSVKIISLVIAVIVLIGCIAVGFYYFQQQPVVQNQLTEQAQQQGVIIEDKKITDNEKPFKIDVSYPFIAGQDDFNARVQIIINNEIADFKKNSLDNDAAVKETDPEGYAQFPREYDLNISYVKGQVDANTVSIMFSVYTFEGGAHGNGYFVAVNYNLAEKKEIALADVFAGQADYVKKISDYAVADVQKQMAQRSGEPVDPDQMDWIKDGAGPNADNFQAFLIKEKSIVFYFPPYQVAPYAAGDFQVEMPR